MATNDGAGSYIPNPQTTSNNQRANQTGNPEIDILNQILKNMEELVKNSTRTSQANARDVGNDVRKANTKFQDDYFDNFFKRKDKKAPKNFSDAFEQSLLEGFLGSDFKDNIGSAVNEFAKMFGSDLENLEGDLGKRLGQVAMDLFKGSSFGQKFTKQFDNLKSQAAQNMNNGFQSGVINYAKASGVDSDKIFETVQGVQGKGLADTIKGLSGMFEGGMDAGAALSGLGGMAQGAISSLGGFAATLGPAAAGLLAIEIASDIFMKQLAKIGQGFKELWDGMVKAANRAEASRSANIEAAQKRLDADVRSLVEEPFNILKEAAQNLYDAWDQNIRTINQTQGYNKSDLQQLMAAFADRLREENLTNVVNGSDLITNLAKVLESGLSGKAAEEFAYQATILNAAVPTQDFFALADTYASVATMAQSAGKSQVEALSYANDQMYSFANNVLYASRQIGGGFSTSLKDATKLYQDAVAIAQASRIGDPAQISGVLTAVSAITGAIAPDLAESMVDAVVKAATGGNSTELVALRSLVGINASNTEFLARLARDPQGVFSEMFSGLARMQNIAPGAYMEVAEGLSSVFGVSMEAFSRVDFNKLAAAIENMDTSSTSLSENLSLLASGQSTTNSEMLRMQQVNQYMLEEGLAYVLEDNVTRAIQEHMWDEQMNRELMEATYSVDLTGSGLKFLESIRSAIEGITTILNPFKWGQKINDLVMTSLETNGHEADIRNLLEAVKVGNGNARDLYRLTTRNVDLNITRSYSEMNGLKSAYESIENTRKNINNTLSAMSIITPTNFTELALRGKDLLDWGAMSEVNASNAIIQMSMNRNSPNSRYSWGDISKSAYQYTHGGQTAGGGVGRSDIPTESASQSAKEQREREYLQEFLSGEAISKYLESNDKATYEDYVKTINKNIVSDFDRLLDKYKISQESAKSQFEQAQSQEGARKLAQRYDDEQLMRDQTREFYRDTKNQWEIENTNWATIIELGEIANQQLLDIFNSVDTFKNHWVERYVTYTAFEGKYNAADVKRIQDQYKDKSEEAIYALADALTQNNVDLLDPTMQTNALLSQILLVAQAIMQQNNTAGKLSLPDSLSAMATGMMSFTS